MKESSPSPADAAGRSLWWVCRERVERAPEPLWILFLILAWLIFLAGSVRLCGSGFLHPESYSFLPHYLSGRPLFDLIYDNRVTDWGHYQARELGFVFDWLDAQFIGWCTGRGWPHFFSASHYVLFLISGFVLWKIATRQLGLSRLAAFGLVLILWTGPTAMLYSSFYRASKVGLLCATLLAICAWLRLARATPGARPLGVMLFGLSLALLPMFDKQGLLFLGGFVLFLARNVRVESNSRNRQLLVAALVAAAFAWSYQRFIGPAVTRHLTGFVVEGDYASIPFYQLASRPGFLARVVLGAGWLSLDSFRLPFGNLSLGLAILAAVGIWRLFAAGAPFAGPRWLAPQWLFLYLGILISAVFAAMLMVFPLMLSIEHRRFFYPLPVSAFWFVIVAAALAEWSRRWTQRARWPEMLVAALLIGNVFALQEHRFILRYGKYRPYVENAERVRGALRPGARTLPRLDPVAARALFEAAPYYEDAVPPSLDRDRIFLLLLSRQGLAD